MIAYDENIVVTSVLHPEAGQFVGPGAKVRLFDPLMAEAGTPTTKEWLDNEYILLSAEEVVERIRSWENRTCSLKIAASKL